MCPVTRTALTAAEPEPEGLGDLGEGELVSEAGRRYELRHGVPVFVPDDLLSEEERQTQVEYDASASL